MSPAARKPNKPKQPNKTTKPTRYVAWLRGINVGGKNLLPMKTLAEIFAAVGCSDVKTYIQSGNVMFSAPAELAPAISAAVSARIKKQLGLAVPVIVRSRKQLERVTKQNPFPTDGEDHKTLHVVFLADVPSAAAIAKLDPNRSPPDEFKVVDGDIYLRTPNGVGVSKLTNAYFDSKLATISTGRNWRTVLKMLELTNA